MENIDSVSYTHLILDDRCTNNIAVYLTKRELTGTGKVAITATVPALRTVVQLAFENQLKEDNLLVLTVDGHGEVIQFKGFDEIKTYLADFPLTTVSYTHLDVYKRQAIFSGCCRQKMLKMTVVC